MAGQSRCPSPPDDVPSNSKTRRPYSHSVLRRAIAFGLAYFLSAEAAAYLTSEPGFVTFWLPSGVFLAALLLNPTKDWLWLALSGFLGNLLFDGLRGLNVGVVLGFYVSNSIQALVGAWAVRRFVAEKPSLDTLKEFFGLLATAAGCPAIGAVFGATVLTLSGFSDSYAQSYIDWWWSNTMSILMVLPFALAWLSRPQGRKRDFDSPGKILEGLLALCGMAVAIWYVVLFRGGMISVYKVWLIPFLLYAGLRLGRQGATAMALLVGVEATFLTTHFLGHSGDRYLILYSVVALVPLVPIFPALALAERERMMARIREREKQIQYVLDNTKDFIFQIDLDGNYIFGNAASEEMTGYSPAELLRMNVRQLVAPGHQAVVDEIFLKAPESPDGERTCECELQRRDGRRIWTEVILGRVSNHEGRPTAIQGVARDVTERKRAAESLEASERRFRTLVEEAPVAVAISREAKTIYVNQKGLKLYGYERVEDVAGRPVTDQWAPEFRPIIKERAERRALGESVPSEYEGIGERKDGSHFPVHVSVASVELSDGAASLVFLTDMTERKASEERFRLLIESASDIITVVNGEGLLRFVSPSVKRSLGYEPEELLNRNMLELMTPEDAPKAAAALQRALNDPTFGASVEYSFFHRDGSCRILQCIGRRLPNAPAEGAIVVNSRDVTESRKLEEQFRQSQKMEAIGQLAGGVAHDFNNIIGAIMIQSDLAVEEKGLSTSTREWLQEIRLAAERAGALTRQLLMFSHRQIMQPRQVSVNDLVFDLSKMLKRIIGEDVRLQLNLHGERLHTFADPGMLDQVLMNLVVNARDAMPSGGKLFIETGERLFTEEEAAGIPDASAGPYVSLRVSDTGFGIPAEVLPKIFDPFFTTKEVGKGTGLGLATVFGIVKQHRGWIHVESEMGKGACFQIYLPAVSPPPEAALTALKPRPRGGSETILLVEDDAPVRVVTKILLEKSGYHVIEAASGADALRLWPEHRTEVDLVLTDLVMPGEIGGQDLARRLHAERQDLKIIFTSGYSADLAGKALEPADCQCFVQKPCPPDQLLETVRGCLDGRS